MNFWILGRVAAGSAERMCYFRSGLQCSLLAALLSTEGQVLSTGALVTELWGDAPPDLVENALQAHISRLRRKLHGIASGCAEMQLVAQAGGYRLTVDRARIDALAFTKALAQARLVAETDPTEASYRLREALALWQGPVFGGAAVGLAAQAAAVRLEECRLSALQLLFDSELRVGLHTAIVPELTELVRAESPNELLCEQLMVALYRCGRQTDALGVYRWIRNRMLDELGVEPSPVLRNHERAILAHHPDLQARQDHVALRNSR